MQLSAVSSPFNGTQLCSQYDLEIFFPEEYTDEAVAAAKEVCSNCWIKDKCLSFALSTNEKEGVWGGTTPKERRSIRRKARR
jgi:WhiB family redox-sensing transcriptional regulator